MQNDKQELYRELYFRATRAVNKDYTSTNNTEIKNQISLVSGLFGLAILFLKGRE